MENGNEYPNSMTKFLESYEDDDMGQDIFSLLLGTTNMLDTYETRKLGCIEPGENNGVGVSTAYVSDLDCWETALLTTQQYSPISPVERYKNKEEARIGHEKWVAFARDKNNIYCIRLGYKLGGIIVDACKVKIR